MACREISWVVFCFSSIPFARFEFGRKKPETTMRNLKSRLEGPEKWETRVRDHEDLPWPWMGCVLSLRSSSWWALLGLMSQQKQEAGLHDLKVSFRFNCSESESCSVLSNSLRPHELHSPWNSPGQNTGVGSLSLLQGLFRTQESNRNLLHRRQILYQLSYQGSPDKPAVYFVFILDCGTDDVRQKANLNNLLILGQNGL